MFILAAACAWGSALAADLDRCPDVEFPRHVDIASAAEMQRAFKGAPRLFFAVGQGSHPLLRRFLVEGDDPNVCVYGMSLLMWRIGMGSAQEVDILLDGGAHPDRPLDALGQGALHHAFSTVKFQAARLLLARGANARLVSDYGSTTLYELAMASVDDGNADQVQEQVDLARELLRRGVPIDAIGSANRISALMLAALQGRTELVRFLIGQGADVNLREVRGQTALGMAQKRNHAAVVDLLLQAGATP